MIRKSLCIHVGAALVGALTVPAFVSAKPPDLPEDGTFTAKPVTPPREDSEITCPYLRQQKIDRAARPTVDPAMNRDVLGNLERLKQADDLLDLAKDLAKDGYFVEAMDCCACAAELCPGSSCAKRAEDTLLAVALGLAAPTMAKEATADAHTVEPSVKELVSELMKVCHSLMSQGQQREAAEIARQAYALDPEQVQADPLLYKMHLLRESPASQPTGATEASEPQTCPYCPRMGKPIREIVPNKKKSGADGASLPVPQTLDYEFEIGANAGGDLRMGAECSLGGNVYHLRYGHGSLAIWTTPDAAKTNP